VSEQEVDLRPELFKLIVDKGWVLLELHRDAQTLEDVFRSLTIGDERRNRSLTASTEDAEDEHDDEENDDDDDEHEQSERVGRDVEKVAKDVRS
jgi:ABC-2 type transport system ATP-binding protein